MKRLLQRLPWLWWTIRHRADPLNLDRPDWTHEELAALPHVRHPEQRLNNQVAADRHERGDH